MSISLATVMVVPWQPWQLSTSPDHLNQGRGYKRDNIIMYSYGAPRMITENLVEPTLDVVVRTYQEIVPNSFAILAKDDLCFTVTVVISSTYFLLNTGISNK